MIKINFRVLFSGISFSILLMYPSVRLSAQSTEIFAGDRNTQLDIQWLKPFGQNSKFLFYNRDRVTVDYDNRTDYFISGITAYQFTEHVGLANEMLITNAGLLPKIGLQYLTASPEKTIYAFFNVGYLKEFNYGFFFFARYQPKISNNCRLYAQLELTNSSNTHGNQFFAERPRLGIGFERLQFGLAGDFTQLGNDFNPAANVGLFIRKEF